MKRYYKGIQELGLSIESQKILFKDLQREKEAELTNSKKNWANFVLSVSIICILILGYVFLHIQQR